VSLDWKCGALADGLSCYGKTEFFEAHEHWESAWLQLEEPEKSFLQALIQITAAFHHLQAGNKVGAASLLRRALRRLEQCSDCFGEIAVATLRDEVREWVRVLEIENSTMPAGFPRICPTEPPETG
jgi:predicted metal-dependent hydrolase